MQTYKYKEPMSNEEKDLRFVIIEDRGTRVLVQMVCDLPFAPTWNALKADIIEA